MNVFRSEILENAFFIPKCEVFFSNFKIAENTNIVGTAF